MYDLVFLALDYKTTVHGVVVVYDVFLTDYKDVAFYGSYFEDDPV